MANSFPWNAALTQMDTRRLIQKFPKSQPPQKENKMTECFSIILVAIIIGTLVWLLSTWDTNMLYYARNQHQIFTFHSQGARNIFVQEIREGTTSITAKQRHALCTQGNTAYMLYNEKCGRYSVIAINEKPKRGTTSR